MDANTISELKAEAKQLGVTWKEVKQVQGDLRKAYLEQRASEEGARQYAWSLYLLYFGRSVEGCKGFWRVGFDRVRERLQNSDRDFTSIPRYDEIATSVEVEYPEWSEQSAEELFAWLFEGYTPRLTAADHYAEALGMIESQVQSVPF